MVYECPLHKIYVSGVISILHFYSRDASFDERPERYRDNNSPQAPPPPSISLIEKNVGDDFTAFLSATRKVVASGSRTFSVSPKMHSTSGSNVASGSTTFAEESVSDNLTDFLSATRNAVASGSRTFSVNPQMQSTSGSNEMAGPMFQCLPCKRSFKSNKTFSLHLATEQHNNVINGSRIQNPQTAYDPETPTEDVEILGQAKKDTIDYHIEWTKDYDQTIPFSILQNCTPTECFVCSVKISNSKDAKTHYLGDIHELNVKYAYDEFSRKNRFHKSAKTSTIIRIRNAKRNDWTLKFDRPIPLEILSECHSNYCRLCGINIPQNPTHYESLEHFNQVNYAFNIWDYKKYGRDYKCHIEWKKNFDVEIPSQITSKCTQFSCGICRVSVEVNGEVNLYKHYTTQRHTKEVYLELQKFSMEQITQNQERKRKYPFENQDEIDDFNEPQLVEKLLRNFFLSIRERILNHVDK